MADKKQEPKQKTQPKKGQPVEIPVPKRQTFMRNLNRVVKADPEKVQPKQIRRKK